MKKLLIVLLLIISVKSFSQNLELFGKVEWHDLKETGKIFWTEEGKNYDAQQFITYDKNRNFNFKIGIDKIKNLNSSVLVFAIDTTKRTSDENACVQRINVLEIVNSSEFKNLKNIKLNTDLLLGINCQRYVYNEAKEENIIKFVGSYNLTINDTLRNIELGNIFFNSHITKQTKDYMNEEFGNWNFNEEKKILTFNVWRQMNKRYGLVLLKKFQFEFIVNNTSGIITFQSEKGVLTKK